MGETNALNQGQLDDFKEIGNIGAGRAAALLSDMIHRRCLISLQEAEYLDAQDVKTKFSKPGKRVVGLITQIHGSVPAWMLTFIDYDSARILVEHIGKKPIAPGSEF